MKKLLTYLIIVAVLAFLSTSLYAQKARRLTVGRFNFTLDAQGATWMSNVGEEGQYGPNIWYNWQAWPDFETDIGYHGVDVNNGEHADGHGKDIHGQSSYWVGSRNWQAPAQGAWNEGAEAVYQAGNLYDVFVNDNGPVTLNSFINTPIIEFPVHKRRIDYPSMVVSDVEQIPIAFEPNGNPYTVDASIISDAMLEASWTDPMGLTFSEKRYGWTHTDYDEFIISEVWVENTGDCSYKKSGKEKENQVLTDFWLGIKHNLGDTDAGFTEFGSFGQYNGQADWFLDYDPAMRYHWAWDGDAADIPGDDQFDPRGGPIGTGTAENPTGEFTSIDVNGIAFIYAGTPSGDDPAQPATFRYRQYKDQKSPVNGDPMIDAFNWMTGGDGADMYQKGFSDNPYGTQLEAIPHFDPVWGIGPYTLNPGDKIKVVCVLASAHLPEARAIELGKKVKDGTMALADAKKEIYEAGRDLLFEKFARAKDLYVNNALQAPFLPDPPNDIVIEPGPEKNSLKWEPPAGGADSYRIYRAIGGRANARVYDMIKETSETEYLDEGLIRGTSYYYYLTAVKGGLESSHFFTRNNKEVVPFRGPVTNEDWAEKVRVVPNPINVKGNTYKENQPHNSTGFNFDGSLREQNTLLFVNLPEECIICIYNSVGDLVKTLNHESGTADERWWPILTDDNLTPASGVYFYTIEVTEGPLKGQAAKGKLVIIR